jgi:uncharacterized phage protein (TIGR01671 family)
MNREIKFRGKDTTGEWWYGNLSVNIKRLADGRTLKGYAIDEMDSSCFCSCIVPETIGQFTGLQDMNGQDIYEGDIFGVTTVAPEVKNRNYKVVKWINDGFYLVDYTAQGCYGNRLGAEIQIDGNFYGFIQFCKQAGYDYAIIGNIHDNPELVEYGDMLKLAKELEEK